MDGRVLTLFRMGFFWAAHGKGAYLSHISYTMKLGIVILYLKKIQKYINHVTHPLSSAEMSIISPEIRNLFYQEIQTAFYYMISNSFKGCFNKHVCNFDDASKFGFSRPSLNEGILKLRFWRDNFCPWRHQQNFITWLRIRCGHVTKDW